MIFVTVGTVDPFDRLVQAVDDWIAEQSIAIKAIAQIGTGSYRPTHCEFVDFLSPREYQDIFSQARLIVSHAGMGTIITALEYNKPILIMPKRASLGEQRNEHQLATARRFRRSAHLRVAEDTTQLRIALNDYFTESPGTLPTDNCHWKPDPTLISFVSEFISNAPLTLSRTARSATATSPTNC